MRAPPRPGTWDNAGCGSYCRRSRYGRSPHSAPHARRAALDGAHHLELVKAHAAAVGIAPCGPVAAEDVRDLQTWPGHAGGLRPRSDCSLRYERREPVQRAHDLANEASTGGTASREPAPAGRREACMRPNGCRPWQARRLALLLCGKLPPGGNRRSKLSGRSAVPTRHFCLISADALSLVRTSLRTEPVAYGSSRRVIRRAGTISSNPLPSSGESGANSRQPPGVQAVIVILGNHEFAAKSVPSAAPTAADHRGGSGSLLSPGQNSSRSR